MQATKLEVGSHNGQEEQESADIDELNKTLSSLKLKKSSSDTKLQGAAASRQEREELKSDRAQGDYDDCDSWDAGDIIAMTLLPEDKSLKNYGHGMVGEHVKVEIVHGNITHEETDAITNAANGNLKHGGGVAGAIVSGGGKEIQTESDEYVMTHGKVQTGDVAVTGPGKLRCQYIIHAVGPIWSDAVSSQENCQMLKNAVLNSLRKADELKCTSISMPAISSGIFGFPKPLCSEIFFKAIKAFVRNTVGEPTLKHIRLTNFDMETVLIFQAEFNKRFK